jgi:hypothetical protein
MANTKVNQGAMLPGVRVNTYSGTKPEFQQGRSGEQYIPWLEKQINEMYFLANIEEIVKEEDGRQTQDLYTELLKRFRFRNKFSLYGEKIERYLKRVVKTGIQIAQKSISEGELVPIVGKGEYLAIPEFKTVEDINYRIKVKPRSNDIETQFGKQVTINHFLQYTGTKMDKEDLGKFIRLSPFLNEEQIFEDFTQKYDNVTNDIVALDRGQWRPPRRYDDHKYIIRMISSRMGKSDFEHLPEPVKFLYERKLRMHEQFEAKALQDLQRAQAGFIPSGGYLVRCDFYTPDPKDPTKTKSLRVPSEALDWLVKALEKQGTKMDDLMNQPVGVLQDISRMVTRPGHALPVARPPQPTLSVGG